jgi:uncharacterized protein YjbJ (UPF0337 family)
MVQVGAVTGDETQELSGKARQQKGETQKACVDMPSYWLG